MAIHFFLKARSWFTRTALAAITTLAVAIPAIAVEPTDVKIRVAAGERQAFAGMGASVANFDNNYGKLPKSTRHELAKMIWTDLRFDILRLWTQTYDYAPTPGARDLSVFKKQYIDSHVLPDAHKFGARTLLLAPDNLPVHMRQADADGHISLKQSETENYAKLIADQIVQLDKELGVKINATGIQNEPSDEQRISPEQLATIVRVLRAELNARGKRDVKIIATENASANDVFVNELDVLKRDADAWSAISGISSHSYNMAATEEVAKRIAGDDGRSVKDYWMTEAAENGHEKPNDAHRAMSVSGRFLNDMNHRVTHWIHFLAYENVRKEDNATCILTFTNDASPTVTPFLKYHTYMQLMNTFDHGAVFRHCTSSLEGEMHWTYGLKPRIVVASAKNPDGSWGVGIVNFTADDFESVQGWGDKEWNRTQGGHTPAQTFRVTIQIEELVGQQPVEIVVSRTSAAYVHKEERVTLRDGIVTINVSSLELVTLRSMYK